jgi:hypothetical protein
MKLELDLLHAIGYLGALGSLAFGANQLRVILAHHSAKDVSAVDYALRVGYSTLLGIYSTGIGDLVFVIVNFGAALLSLAVALASFRMQKRQASG